MWIFAGSVQVRRQERKTVMGEFFKEQDFYTAYDTN